MVTLRLRNDIKGALTVVNIAKIEEIPTQYFQIIAYEGRFSKYSNEFQYISYPIYIIHVKNLTLKLCENATARSESSKARCRLGLVIGTQSILPFVIFSSNIYDKRLYSVSHV